MTDGRDMSWLQDTTKTNAQSSWGAEYRDVIILDAWNRPVEPRFNLTTYDLASEVNRGVLKELLRRAAVMVDVDDDGIGDDWEERYFSGLTESPTDDRDMDGGDHFLEYALGSRPNQAASLPTITTGTMMVDDLALTYLKFRRRLGAAKGLTYIPESSQSGDVWINASDRWTLSERTNPYDGTGTEIVTYVLSNPGETSGLFRIKVGFE